METPGKPFRSVWIGGGQHHKRLVPLPDLLDDFLASRKEWETGELEGSGKNIDELPIACEGKDFETEASGFKVSGACTEVMLQTGVQQKTITDAWEHIISLQTNPKKRLPESDGSEYLMRFNLLVQYRYMMYGPHGEDYTNYLMGIAEHPERMEGYSSAPVQHDMKEKLSRWPLFNKPYVYDSVFVNVSNSTPVNPMMGNTVIICITGYRRLRYIWVTGTSRKYAYKWSISGVPRGEKVEIRILSTRQYMEKTMTGKGMARSIYQDYFD